MARPTADRPTAEPAGGADPSPPADGGRERARLAPRLRQAWLRANGNGNGHVPGNGKGNGNPHAPEQTGVAAGRARVDRRTKNLIPRLQPGEIAVIDHEDLDRGAAEGLIRSRAAA